MILAKGILYESKEQDTILANLETEINITRSTKKLVPEKVVSALDKLGQAIAEGVFAEIIDTLNIDGVERYIEAVILALKRENIEYKIKTELGMNWHKTYRTEPPMGQQSIYVETMPLGTLLHIAAGNVDGLPAYSVAEGLITGNVNILKLPQADNGLSVKIIMKLIEIEPDIAEFIYVFDTPSSDVLAIKKMAEMADGIVVWGGDTAIAAVRRFANQGCKLIEWGHKLGFAYLSGFEDREAELRALAEHIVVTRQLLCSSCQTIYIDTYDLNELHLFCTEFLPYLETASQKNALTTIDAVAERTLRKYNRNLESVIFGKDGNGNNSNIYAGDFSSLTICEDSTLELSDMFGNCLVKRLPKSEIIMFLRKSKGVLQTAGLICRPEYRNELTELLARSGVVRIMRAGEMSAAFSGEAHDGEYALRRYIRYVNIQP